MAKQNPPTNARLAAFLQARIDRELARPADVQDRAAIDRDTVLLCALTQGSDLPDPRRQKRALRQLRHAVRNLRAPRRNRHPMRRFALVCLTVLLLIGGVLTISAAAGLIPAELWQLFLSPEPEETVLEEIFVRGVVTYYPRIEDVERDGKLDFVYPRPLKLSITGITIMQMDDGELIELSFKDPELHLRIRQYDSYHIPSGYFLEENMTVRMDGHPLLRRSKRTNLGNTEYSAYFLIDGDEYILTTADDDDFWHLLILILHNR